MSKQTIEKKTKEQVWKNYFDNNNEGICLCCKQIEITRKSFHAGHIISEAQGGLAILENLVPICRNCNNKCGQKNLIDFAKENYNNEIIPKEEYWGYIENINNGNDIFYNTKQLFKKINKDTVFLLINYIFKNIELEYKTNENNECMYISESKYSGPIYFENYKIFNIEVIKKEDINYDEVEYKIIFHISFEKTYNIKIKCETKLLEKIYAIKTLCIKDLEMPKCNIEYPLECIDDKCYVTINNKTYTWSQALKSIGVEVDINKIRNKNVDIEKFTFYNNLTEDDKKHIKNRYEQLNNIRKCVPSLLITEAITTIKKYINNTREKTNKKICEEYGFKKGSEYCSELIKKILEIEFSNRC